MSLKKNYDQVQRIERADTEVITGGRCENKKSALDS